MPIDVQPHGVGVIGSEPFSRFVLERLSLRNDFTAAACWSPNGSTRLAIPGSDCVVHTSPRSVIDDARTDVIYFDGIAPPEVIALAIESQKSVIVESISEFSSGELHQLAELANGRGVIAVVDAPRRWADDFVLAKSLIDSGQLGRLERIRFAIHEQSLPGESFHLGVLRELGCHWLDQLLVFVQDDPIRVHFRTFHESAQPIDDGFLAMIEFHSGTSAVIEVQTASVLSLRTGWLLEGISGAYRGGRLYTRTADGEIIDEPVSRPTTGSDPFFDALAAGIHGDASALASLPDLRHCTRIMKLVEVLNESDER